jgi:two-component system nitrate/nitrite response regulator NarL
MSIATSENGLLVRVLVVEDHPLYRYALEETISRSAHLSLVACCPTASEAVLRTIELEPDVALVDRRLAAGEDGISVLEAVQQRKLKTRVVILSADRESASVAYALDAGAVGYLSKDVDAGSLVDAVRTAATGRAVFSADMHEAVAEAVRGRQAQNRPLSGRESHVMHLAAVGTSVSAMAVQMHLSQTTVKTHLTNAYRKLGARDRASAVAQALTRGLITLD